MSMNVRRNTQFQLPRHKNQTFFTAAMSGDGSVLLDKKDEILTVHKRGHSYHLVGSIGFAGSGPYGLSANGHVLAWLEAGNLHMLQHTPYRQFELDKANNCGAMENGDHVRLLVPSNDGTMIAAIFRSECRVYSVKDVQHAIATLPFTINDPIQRTVQFSPDGAWIHLIENTKVNKVRLS